jgi:hypothetical protein
MTANNKQQQERLAQLITSHTDYVVKCMDSDKRAENIDDAYSIHYISVSTANKLIIVYYFT